MSRFLRRGLRSLVPYVPGEQPKSVSRLIKLNTNESPFPPSPRVVQALSEAEVSRLGLYSDPTADVLHRAIADFYGVSTSSVVCSNGSDEILAFALDAFCDRAIGFQTPDITYGFYPVLSGLYEIPMRVNPLKEDFSVDVESFLSGRETVVLANPNAQTGIALPLGEIERIVSADSDRVVIIDEAYVDFGAESAVSLIGKYDNLLVVQTFSKSRSLAGARIGFALGAPSLIADLETVRNSFNPYNLNRLSLLAGAAAISDVDYFETTRREVIRVRESTKAALSALGFVFPPSCANFILARHPEISGEALCRALREKGIIVRHFKDERICDYARITVGSADDMASLISALKEILGGNLA